MKIKNEEIMPARRAVRALLDYEHPSTRAGVRQDTTLKLMRLDRALRVYARDYEGALKALIGRYGEEKTPGNPESAFVTRDSPHFPDFSAARRELMAAEVEIDDALLVKLSELRVREEGGELVEIECGKIADLGSLLIIEEEAPKVARKDSFAGKSGRRPSRGRG